MKLFELSGDIENRIVKPTEEALMVTPFGDIYQRDSHRQKDLAMREFAYIEFMVSPKDTNPFFGYPVAGGIRHQKIYENKFKDLYETWTPDELVRVGIEVYNEFYYNASPSLGFYNSVVGAVKKLQTFFDNLDMDKVNSRDMPLYKPKEITSAIIDAENLLTKLAAMKEKVNQEIFTTVKTKGARQINFFEQ